MDPATPVNIAIIEDHHDIRMQVENLVNSHPGFICKGFAAAEEALKEFETFTPSIVLMDINLPGMDGIECTKKVKELYPSVLVMMCTIYEDDEKIFRALTSGASGYVLKSTSGEQLMEDIRMLLNGGAPMSPAIARKVVTSFRRNSNIPSSQEFQLTPRENEILDLLAQGFRNKEIADKLFVSINTIRTHIYNIYEKLHVQNRVEALNKTGRAGRN